MREASETQEAAAHTRFNGHNGHNGHSHAIFEAAHFDANVPPVLGGGVHGDAAPIHAVLQRGQVRGDHPSRVPRLPALSLGLPLAVALLVRRAPGLF